MPIDTSYNSNFGLLVRGVLMTLDAVTGAALSDVLATYRAPYSAATLLSGLGIGMPAGPTPLKVALFETSFAEPCRVCRW
jgi:hypothetical protein